MLYPTELRARIKTAYRTSLLCGRCSSYGVRCRRLLRSEHRKLLDDIKTGASKQLVNRCLVEAGRVVLHQHSLLGLVESNAANAINLANPGDCERCGLGRWHTVPVKNVKLGHMFDDSSPQRECSAPLSQPPGVSGGA